VQSLEDDRRAGLELRDHPRHPRSSGERHRPPGDVLGVLRLVELLAHPDETERGEAQARLGDETLRVAQ
jgi:hypothetical protein